MRTRLALCLLAFAVSGCGAAAQDSAEEFKGEERKVAATVEGIETAAREDKPDTVCDKLLTDGLLSTLRKQGTNCKTAVKQGFADADSLDIAVKDVTIRGDKAVVKLVSGSGSKEKNGRLGLERDGTIWKIDQQLVQ